MHGQQNIKKKGQHFVCSGDWTTPSFVQPLTFFTPSSSKKDVIDFHQMWYNCFAEGPLPPQPPKQSHNFSFPAVSVRINKTADAKKCLCSTEFDSNK